MKSAILSVVGAAAVASTISVSDFSKANYDAAVGSMSGPVIQNFETYGEGNVADGFSTNVGSFSTLGGVGSGGTVNFADFDNDGALLALRDGNVYGRSSTTPTLTSNLSHRMFLDSNDTHGIVWNLALESGRMFDRVVFSVTDAAEFGATLRISANGGMAQIINGANAASNLVEIDFGQPLSEATVTLGHFNGNSSVLNDGFSIDDIAVNEVPLPASALLLLGGLGGFAAMRRRKG